MSSPVVSVIVPNYNHSKFLQKRLDSILNQTYQDFEVIILDDCSQDNSTEIIESYREHPNVITIEYNAINSGSPFKQWAKGISLSKGEYIWIAESDDWCEPSFLDTLVSPMLKDPKIKISYCQSICLDQNNKIKWVSNHEFLEQVIEGEEFVRQFMLKGNSIFNASMAVFRKTALPLKDHYIHYQFCGDWFFWIEVALKGDVLISGKVLNYFRKHSQDISSKARVKGLYYLESTDIILHTLQKIKHSEREVAEIIEKRARSFLEDENAFESQEVRNKVISKLNELDPSFVRKTNRIKTSQKIGNIKRKINARVRKWDLGGSVLL
ncbi:MAG: glycosyltransferase family 2 protein [Lewinellaceae bacterium]|nr:glycosyltransferase family 2 protein [Lewinellaceae bacterium]